MNWGAHPSPTPLDAGRSAADSSYESQDDISANSTRSNSGIKASSATHATRNTFGIETLPGPPHQAESMKGDWNTDERTHSFGCLQIPPIQRLSATACEPRRGVAMEVACPPGNSCLDLVGPPSDLSIGPRSLWAAPVVFECPPPQRQDRDRSSNTARREGPLMETAASHRTRENNRIAGSCLTSCSMRRRRRRASPFPS